MAGEVLSPPYLFHDTLFCYLRKALSITDKIIFSYRFQQVWIHKCVAIGYTQDMTRKNVGIRVRVDAALREDFLSACQAQGYTGSHVLRAFMRRYVQRHWKPRQQELFPLDMGEEDELDVSGKPMPKL